MLIFVRKSACKIAAVEEGDRTWPEVAPEVASQKAKKITRPDSKLLFIQRMRYIEQHRLQIDTT